MRVEKFIEICKKYGLEQLTEDEAVKIVMGGKHYVCFSLPEDHDRVIAQLNRNNNQIKLKNAIEGANINILLGAGFTANIYKPLNNIEDMLTYVESIDNQNLL